MLRLHIIELGAWAVREIKYYASATENTAGGKIRSMKTPIPFNLSPEVIATKTIDQLVSFFGDGKLRDKSECSIQLRAFLQKQTSLKLAEFAKYCLDVKFEKSGQVLQDVVNEIGSRLGYSVENGRYGGTTKDIGFDGLWNDGTNWLVVEVKTTDAFRINLNTTAGYSKELQAERSLSPTHLYTLIVVGRRDTGDLEAQVRGSPYAWTVRLISVESLIKLMYVREELDDEKLHAKIKQVLLPIEYTRVDYIVDLVFETQQESDQKAQSAVEFEEAAGDEKKKATDERQFVPQFTPKQELEDKRQAIINSFFSSKKATPESVTLTSYEDSSKVLRATMTLSKRYKSDYQPYWYALHPRNLEFLKGTSESYLILGCMDLNVAYALPIQFVEGLLGDLNKTEKEDRHYWHLALQLEDGKLLLNLTKVGRKIDLAPYAFELSVAPNH